MCEFESLLAIAGVAASWQDLTNISCPFEMKKRCLTRIALLHRVAVTSGNASFVDGARAPLVLSYFSFPVRSTLIADLDSGRRDVRSTN